MHGFRLGDRVVVNTGGADASGVVMQLNKRLGVRVAFANGTSQWMDPHHMRHATETP